MSFRYINPGYSRLTTYNYYSSYCDDVIDSTKSRTGAAYYNTSYERNAYQFSALPANGEYWVKFDFYYTGTSYLYARETTSYYSGLQIEINSSTSATIKYYSRGSYYTLISNADTPLTGLKMNNVNTIWLHIKWGDAGIGFLEFQINNLRFAKIQDKTFYKPSSFIFGISYNSTSGYFSSVIISDEEINPYEKVVALPVANTSTDMSPRDEGGYIASDTSQTLLQSVDTTALIERYGSDAQDTSVALVGRPAYEAAEILGKLTSISKRGDTITEYETIQLSNNTSAAIVSGISMETTLADLPNVQFGWKASE